MDVLAMIDEIQAKAKAANGRLDDLALPPELYDIFMKQLYTMTPKTFDTSVRIEDGVVYYNGSKIHTGDND